MLQNFFISENIEREMSFLFIIKSKCQLCQVAEICIREFYHSFETI